MHTRTRRFGAALAALSVCAGLTGLALAHGQTAPTGDEQAALDRFCDDPGPCTIISGAADPTSGDGEATLVTPPEELADSGKPPSACPDATQAYRELGVQPDAYVGGCPDDPPATSAKAARRLRAGDRLALRALREAR